MNAKQRDSAFQHWQSVILRETRDLASLERIAAAALQDRNVRSDPALEGLIRSHVAARRADIERERWNSDLAARQARPSVRPVDFSGHRSTSVVSVTPLAESRSEPPPPVPPPPDSGQAAFHDLAKALAEPMARGDEVEAGAVCERMAALQQASGGAIPEGALAPYEMKLAKLRARLGQFRIQIAALVQEAIARAREGDEPAAAALLRRLTAIHVTYPQLLAAARLDEVRAQMLHASEQHDDGLAARRLLDREQAVATEIRRIAAAVHQFYRVVCTAPESSEAFRSAEAQYQQTLRDVRTHDSEWLVGFVLELADLLAEWRLPRRAVRKQVDRFLERVRVSMQRIRTEVGRIDSKRNETDAP
jgi:hypothetical protein